MEGIGRGRRMNVDGRSGWREWRRERLMRWEDAGIRCEGEEEQDEKKHDQVSRTRIWSTYRQARRVLSSK